MSIAKSAEAEKASATQHSPKHGPQETGDVGHSDAVDLFIDRAATVTPAYSITPSNAATISHICERLDGLPLAIELAAGWIRVLSARDLLAEINRSTEVLTSSGAAVADRHRSIRAVLESSWQSLEEEERRVFAGLGLFANGFTREAAEVVARASLTSLASLAERSLIQRMPDSSGGTRYHVHELVRTYALERLEGPDKDFAEAVRARYFEYFLGLAERLEAVWDTPNEPECLDNVRADHANLDSAVLWAIDRGHAERALRMSAGLFTFWMHTSSQAQSAAILTRALALPWDASSPTAIRARAKALNVAGYSAIAVPDFALAEARSTQGLTLYERLGDQEFIAWNLRGSSYARLLFGDLAASAEFAERSLTICRSIGDLRGIAWSIHDLGEVAFAAGDLDQAQAYLEDALGRFQQVGATFGTHSAHIVLGNVHRERSQPILALEHYVRGLALQAQLHFTARGADVLEAVAAAAAVAHRPELAARLFGAGAGWHENFGWPRLIYNRAAFDRDIAMARRQIGESAWKSSYAAGGQLTSDQAQRAAEDALQELAAAVAPLPSGLTQREVEVLRLVTVGLSNADIATRLVVSPRTVHAHLRSIFDS